MSAFIGQRFAIIDKKAGAFVYTDMGSVKFDAKMPRRSATVNTIEEARTLKAKIERLIAKNIAESLDYEKAEKAEAQQKPNIVTHMTATEWKHSRLKYAKMYGDIARRLQQAEIGILKFDQQLVD